MSRETDNPLRRESGVIVSDEIPVPSVLEIQEITIAKTSLTRDQGNELRDCIEALKLAVKVLEGAAEKVSPVSAPAENATQRRSYMDYFRFRYEHSSFVKFIKGKGMSAEDVDTAIGTFTLLNALLLTIPFSMVGSLGFGYWDALEAIFAKCPNSKNLGGNTLETIFRGTYQQLCGTIYSSISNLLMACFYYSLRPKSEEDFKAWWPRGMYVVVMLLIGTLLSVVCALTLAGTMVTGFWFFSPTSYRCDDDNIEAELYVTTISVGLFFVVVPSLVAIALMF